EDLFHRLNVIRLRLPALRERREDIPMLTRHFLQVSARQLGVDPKRISDAALARLEQFGFPGNVRQLENICHWLTVMAPAQVISVQDLPPEVLETAALAVQQVEMPGDAGLSTSGSVQRAFTAAGGGSTLAETQVGVAAAGTGAIADWELGLAREVRSLLAAGRHDLWEFLSQRFEACLISHTLDATHGRRMEAAQRLGIGRNTITRKIQELGLEGKSTHENSL
ncbi:MAG: helix-turn-helix domain-containing protein, partial [Giesbergeria sp.]